MGLINKKSNLKNSKYIPDLQGGGSSGLPYNKIALPEDSPAGEYLAGITRTSADFPLRGGTYSTIASTEDTIRISRFLNDFPKGALFTSKQVGLQKSNPKIESGVLGERLNTQTYNLNANLLAQVAEQGTGIHINRAGFNTNELDNDKNKYAYIASHKSSGENRLVNLFNSKISGDYSSNVDLNSSRLGISRDDNALFNYSGGPGSLYGDGNTYISRVVNTSESWEDFKSKGYSNPLYTPSNSNLSPIPVSGKFNSILRSKFPRQFEQVVTTEEVPNVSFEPDGTFTESPSTITQDVYLKQEILNEGYLDNFIQQESTLAQQGGTVISGDFIRPEKSPSGISLINEFNSSMGYSQLLSAKDNDLSTYQLRDFRKKTNSPQSRIYEGEESKLVNIATRIGIGNPGARTNAQRTSTNTVIPEGQDKVNMIPLYTDSEDPFYKKLDARDLIKFAFEVINNDNLLQTTKVHFRAFLTNFSDNHSAEWNGQNYMGRGEKFYTYQGATRQVSFNFKVAAQSKQEMMPLYQKLNYIVSSLYSDYNDDGFMRGNIHKLTLGEYFYRTPGIITSMNITVEDDYPWEIKYSEPETRKKFTRSDFPNPVVKYGSSDFEESNSDADMMELPQVLNVAVTFIPILDGIPSLSKHRAQGNSDKKGILITTNVGLEENYITRIDYVLAPPPQAELDPDIPPINTDNN
jgi:hypothetical protein